MKIKLLIVLINAIYSILGWCICIIQIGSSMISNYNQYLTLALAVLQLSVGLFINFFSYFLIKKKSLEKAKNYKELLRINCVIIILPYVLIILLWMLGWF
ncbi:MAG: hypothetical protein K2G45_08235 [Lachnospiraceae bacterium]|nr:hypothetical protein [Lachnospiraceae bacterium]